MVNRGGGEKQTESTLSKVNENLLPWMWGMKESSQK